MHTDVSLYQEGFLRNWLMQLLRLEVSWHAICKLNQEAVVQFNMSTKASEQKTARPVKSKDLRMSDDAGPLFKGSRTRSSSVPGQKIYITAQEHKMSLLCSAFLFCGALNRQVMPTHTTEGNLCYSIYQLGC